MSKQPWIVLAIAALLLNLPWLGLKDFSTRGEPREALVIQDIVESGSWVLAHGYGGVVPSKPPLMHWFSAWAASVGGMNEFSARLPSCLAGLLVVLGLVFFLRTRLGEQRALISGWMIMLSVEWFRSSTTARVDMTLACALTFGFIGAFRWYEVRFKGIPWLAIFAFTLATLTKGPVAILLPGIVLGLFFLIERIALQRVLTILIFLFTPVLCCAALWYLAAYLERPEEFLAKVWYENVARFLSQQDDEPHKGSMFALWGGFLISVFPWSFYFLSVCFPIRLKGVLSRLMAYWNGLTRLECYALMIVVCFLLFFAIPSSKRSVYLLPALPWALVLLSNWFQNPRLYPERLRWLHGTFLLTITGLTAFVCFLPSLINLLRPLFKSDRSIHDLAFAENAVHALPTDATWWQLSLLIGSCAVILLSWHKLITGKDLRFLHLCVPVYVVLLVGNAVLFPLVGNRLSFKPFAQTLSEMHRSPAEKWYSFGTEFYGLSFYAGRPMFRLEESGRDVEGLVVVDKEDLPKLRAFLDPQATVLEVARSKQGVGKPSQQLLAMEVRQLFNPLS